MNTFVKVIIIIVSKMKKELIELIENEIDVRNQICSEKRTTQNVNFGATKISISDDFRSENADVKCVASVANFIDSHLTVMGDTSYNRSINERGLKIPHITDHNHVIKARVGRVKEAYTEKIIVNGKETVALIFESETIEDYNPEGFRAYENEDVDQHSIGFNFVNMFLCINPEFMRNDKGIIEENENTANWKKYSERIVNLEVVAETGFFWYSTEIRIAEFSAVLIGSCSITPTLYSYKKTKKGKKIYKKEIDTSINENQQTKSDTTPKKSEVRSWEFN